MTEPSGNDVPAGNLPFRRADAATEEQVVELLLHRFSGGREGAVKFSTAQFRQSFDSLFGLVLQSGNRLSPDFAFVGLLLASLFISLETLDVELDVLPQYRAAVGARI